MHCMLEYTALLRSFDPPGSVRLRTVLAILIGLLFSAVSMAETLLVVDLEGSPVPNAIVLLPTTAPTTSAPQAVVDQIGKRFVPYVSVVSTNSWVRFPNSDDTRHSVYSFSDAKTFELKLYHANDADPVLFDKPGLVTLGCNVHDHMKAYVLVTDQPGVVTNEQGYADMNRTPPDEAPGATSATNNPVRISPNNTTMNTPASFKVWHPQLEQAMPIDLSLQADNTLVLPIHWDDKDPQASKSRSALENKFKSFKRNAN